MLQFVYFTLSHILQHTVIMSSSFPVSDIVLASELSSDCYQRWKEINEFVSPTSIIGEEITHDERRIICSSNIKSLYNIKLTYNPKLTARKHTTYSQNLMLCYCMGEKNKSICKKQRKWIRRNGELILFETTNEHSDNCNPVSRSVIPSQIYRLALDYLDDTNINIGNHLYNNLINTDQIDKDYPLLHILGKMVGRNLSAR